MARNPEYKKNFVNSVPFTKDNQPSVEAKLKGWRKKKRAQELAKAVLDLAFKGLQNSGLKQAAAEYFGMPADKITVEMMMLFRQAEKAIQKADTQAFKAMMERAHGMPKQDISLPNNDVIIKITNSKK